MKRFAKYLGTTIVSVICLLAFGGFILQVVRAYVESPEAVVGVVTIALALFLGLFLVYWGET